MGAGEIHSPLSSSGYRRILGQPHNHLVLLSAAALGATFLTLGLCKMTSEHGTRVHEEICGERGSRRDCADHRKGTVARFTARRKQTKTASSEPRCQYLTERKVDMI